MKLKNILYLSLTGIVLLSGCEKEPVVLEFNEKYSPAPPKPGDKLPLPPVDLLTVYAYFLDNEPTLAVPRNIGSDGSLSISEIADKVISLKTTTTVEEETKVVVEKMTADNNKGSYHKIIKGLTVELPETAYSLIEPEITAQKGSKMDATVRIKFNKDEFLKLDKTKTYALPLFMKQTGENVKIANHFVLRINLQDTKPLPQGDNVEVVYSSPQGITIKGSSELTVASDYAAEHLYKIVDGDNSTNWWVKTWSDTWLTVSLKKTMKIKAIVLRSRTNGKRMKSIKVAVTQDGNTYIDQGKLTDMPSSAASLFVSFKRPVAITGIKMTDFVGHNEWIDIHEVELIAEK